MDKGSYEGGGDTEKALITSAPPTPVKEAPSQVEKIMRRIVQVGQLKGVGRSPSSLLTQQLAQIAVEAGPSTLGGEEPARRKLQPTMGGKAPQKEFLHGGRLRRPGSTGLAQLLFGRSSGSKRAQSSSFGNSPSHGQAVRQPQKWANMTCASRGVLLYACRKLQRHIQWVSGKMPTSTPYMLKG